LRTRFDSLRTGTVAAAGKSTDELCATTAALPVSLRSIAPLLSALFARFGFEFLGFLASRYPHDLDGDADHVGGALLALRASGQMELRSLPWRPNIGGWRYWRRAGLLR
jgi:hypothetical protein